jgi:hypothetical protein
LIPIHVLKILCLLAYSAILESLTTKIEAVLNTVLKRVLESEERERMRRRYRNNCIMRDSVIGTHFRGIED